MTTTKLTSATTDNQLITTWLNSKPSKLTQKQYSYNVIQFMNFVGKELSVIALEDLQMYVRMLEMKGYAKSTIKVKLTSIKSLFSFATQVGYLAGNPCLMVKNPKTNTNLSDKIVNHSDIQLLVKNAKTDRDKLIIKVLYSLGLRISECVNLKWSDFSFDGDFINLSVIGKGEKLRTILVNPSLYNQLLKLQRNGIDYVFTAYQRNRPLTRQSVNIFLNKLTKKCGIGDHEVAGKPDRITPHKFRHSHATESIKNGCDLSLLQQSLGHASIRTTEVYLNLRKNEGSSTFKQVDSINLKLYQCRIWTSVILIFN